MKNRACSILIGFNRTFEEHWVLANPRGKQKILKLFLEVYILKVLSVFIYAVIGIPVDKSASNARVEQRLLVSPAM